MLKLAQIRNFYVVTAAGKVITGDSKDIFITLAENIYCRFLSELPHSIQFGAEVTKNIIFLNDLWILLLSGTMFKILVS